MNAETFRPIDPSESFSLNEAYRTNGFVVVPNFFKPEFAEKSYNWYHHDMPDDWWVLTTVPTKQRMVRLNPENESLAEEVWNEAGEAVNRDGLSYRFFRTDEHTNVCPCYVCQMTKFFHSETMIGRINDITNENITNPNAMFASKYTDGCFLTSHTDMGHGKVAFVYNMTKNWLPYWGGMLHFLEPNCIQVRRVVYPEFNSMVLFHIPEKGTPHFVSCVADGVKEKRLAFSGWFR